MLNQVPENMGQKIVAALRQSEMQSAQNEIEKTDFNQIQETENQTIQENKIYEDMQSVSSSNLSMDMEMDVPQFNPYQNQNSINDFSAKIPVSSFDFEVPTNVAVLKKLISELPQGVTKSVGALIIRQTLEALGISMKGVLKEAQQVQENFNIQIKSCNSQIQDCRNQIQLLEKNVLDYQRQMTQLNDLISLFIMSDSRR